MEKQKIVIGIVGKIGSGKDEAAKYLSSALGWPIFQISAPLKEEVKRRGLDLNRENLQKIGIEVAEKKGDDYLARLALASFKQNGIVSGPRQLGQMDYFKKNSRFILIFVDAPDQIRFERVTKRATVNEARSLREFVSDEIERDTTGNVVRLNECIQMASYKIMNDSTLEQLKSELDKIIEKENLIEAI